ncbi:HEAT repeat domain-containing protein [Candidatus Poribacteria bacterium]|jgi:HEAT repeat protein|nr:HEAT repeat domain-containing protein [Candidatus Poribacteria bacterium]MBT5534707.1 HEAT repeat domain-containing protein [Candidatus Poribacteria bacterium]MBT5715257.1 HEAT repeat domain-containing protein [Candidatus Poribacteria bacterium]MBT7101338.1 HEAT repeat domain-containing protein [Candidatus Poribacteria bacterium]MBT7809048.1 HEAT repeat domain-containing protein [Candidatus Poribacteria bacterium]
MRVRMLRYVRRAAVISSPLCILAVLALTIGCQQDPTIAAIDGLKSSSASERLQAVQVLAEASSARLTTEDRAKVEVALGEALSDADDQVRMKAVQGVMNWPKAIHQTKAATALGTLVVSDDAAFRRGAVDLLGRISNAESTAALATALSQDAGTRQAAAKALAARDAALTGDDAIRLDLVLGNSEIVATKGAAVLPALQAMLDEDAGYRAAAATAIGLIGDADSVAIAVDKVLSDLESDDVAVRLAAVGALGALRDAKAIAPLENRAENDPDTTVRASARVAAHVVQNDTVSLLGTLEDADMQVQMVTVRGIRNVENKRPAVDPLVRLLRRTTNQELANETITTLAACGSLAVAPLLTHIAEEPEWGLRLRLATALGQPTVLAGMDYDRQVELSNLWEAEVNDNVKNELGRVLNEIPE